MKHILHRLLLVLPAIVVVTCQATAQPSDGWVPPPADISLDAAIAVAYPLAVETLGEDAQLVLASADVETADLGYRGLDLSTGLSGIWTIFYLNAARDAGFSVTVTRDAEGELEYVANDDVDPNYFGEPLELGGKHDTPERLVKALAKNNVLDDFLEEHLLAYPTSVFVDHDEPYWEGTFNELASHTIYALYVRDPEGAAPYCACAYSLENGETECVVIDATIADMHEIPDATVSDEFEAEEPPQYAADLPLTDAIAFAREIALDSLGNDATFADAYCGYGLTEERKYIGLDLTTGFADHWIITFVDKENTAGIEVNVQRDADGETFAYANRVMPEQLSWLRPLPEPTGRFTEPGTIIEALSGNEIFIGYMETYPDAITVITDYSMEETPADWEKFSMRPGLYMQISGLDDSAPSCFCGIRLEDGYTECLVSGTSEEETSTDDQ